MSTTLSFFPVTGDFQAVDDVLIQSTTITPPVDVVSALVNFTPRLPRGFQAFVSDLQVSTNTNNKQTITLIGAITGGTYALEFSGVWTATGIAPGASAGTVQTALRALSTIGSGNVNVTGPNGGPYDCEFVGALANQALPQMIADYSELTASSGSPGVRIVMLQPGSVSRVAPAAISIPVRQGRIWTNGRLCSINVNDSPGVDLLPNLPALGIDFDLIYDVTFSAVRFNGVDQTIAPYAFVAPTDTTSVCITDPLLDKLEYQSPIATTWYPGYDPSTTSFSRISAYSSGSQTVADPGYHWGDGPYTQSSDGSVSHIRSRRAG